MAYWNIAAPDYVPPTKTTPSWVWSIVGRAYDSSNLINVLIIRLDYVMLDNNGGFVRVNNFRPGWSSGNPTCYRPIFMQLGETQGSAGSSHVAQYDYWASQGANLFWKNYIYKFLYGIRAAASLVAYIPL